MKIAKSVRDAYQDQYDRLTRLEREVKAKLKAQAESRGWFFTSRIKTLDSFALKLETGRFPDPRNLEDFLGVMIVVPTLTHMESAEELVCDLFDLTERRPADDRETLKSPSDFRFDDLRLYVAQRASPSGRNGDLVGLVFEAQIKTALQYAWGVAVHDLIYKTDSVSWPLDRIAFQLKAMLEHAEISIAAAEQLSTIPAVSKDGPGTADLLLVIQQMKRIWTSDRLPTNLKLLASNILRLLQASGFSAGDLAKIVANERRRIGQLPSNLSPYSFVLQAVAHNEKSTLHRALGRGKISILLHPDIDAPEWLLSERKGVISL